MLSTGEGFNEYCTSGGFYEYVEGYHDSYQRMEIMSTLGEISTLTGYHEYIGKYHDSCGGYHLWDTTIQVGAIMSTSVDAQCIRLFSI